MSYMTSTYVMSDDDDAQISVHTIPPTDGDPQPMAALILGPLSIYPTKGQLAALASALSDYLGGNESDLPECEGYDFGCDCATCQDHDEAELTRLGRREAVSLD